MVPKRNRYKELLPAQFRGKYQKLKHRARKALAEHQRILMDSRSVKTGVRRKIYYDGVIIKTWINNWGRFPILQVAVFVPSEEGLIIPENEFVLERGLLITIPPEIRIYVGTDLVSEWQGDPPLYSWGNFEHPQGELSLLTTTCGGARNAPTWTGAETLGIRNEYVSRATGDQINSWRAEQGRDSCLYTGLLRLLAEGWGPHEDFRKLQPEGWPRWEGGQEPGYRGVIRFRDDENQTYRYFLVYLGPTIGCRAIELSFDDSVLCLVDELYEGGLTLERKLITEAWVLRKVLRDPAAEERQLISQQQYTQTVIGFRLEHGWKFCPQRFGSALESTAQANIVVLEYEEGPQNTAWYNTRHIRVNFTLNGILQANMSTVEQGKVYFDSGDVHHPLWEESADGGLLVRMMPREGALFPNAPPDLSDETPVYAKDYDDTGVDILRYVKKELVSEPGNPTYLGSRLTSCQGEVDEEQWYREDTLTIKGGWKTSSVNFTKELVIGVSERWTRRFWHNAQGPTLQTANRSSSRGCGCSGSSITPAAWRSRYETARGQSCDPSAVDAEWDAMAAHFADSRGDYGTVEAQGSHGSLEREEERFSAGDYGGHGVIISKLDATAVILMTGQSRNQREIKSPGGQRVITRDISEWSSTPCTTKDFETTSNTAIGAWKFSMVGRVNEGDPLTCLESSWFPYLGDSCYNNDPNGGCTSSQSFETVESFDNPNSGELKITGQGIVIDGTDQFEDIKDYIEASVLSPSRPWRPFVRFQYGTNAVYQEKPELPGKGIKSNAGFSEGALDEGEQFRFLSS